MKKVFPIILSLGMMAALAGCSGGAAAASAAVSTKAESTMTESAEAGSTAAAPAAGSSSSGETAKADTTADLKGEIHYVSMWNETEPQADVIKSAIKEFTAAYPGVKIKVDWMGRDTLKTIKAA